MFIYSFVGSDYSLSYIIVHSKIIQGQSSWSLVENYHQKITSWPWTRSLASRRTPFPQWDEQDARKLETLSLRQLLTDTPFNNSLTGPGAGAAPRRWLGVVKPQILFEMMLRWHKENYAGKKAPSFTTFRRALQRSKQFLALGSNVSWKGWRPFICGTDPSRNTRSTSCRTGVTELLTVHGQHWLLKQEHWVSHPMFEVIRHLSLSSGQTAWTKPNIKFPGLMSSPKHLMNLFA